MGYLLALRDCPNVRPLARSRTLQGHSGATRPPCPAAEGGRPPSALPRWGVAPDPRMNAVAVATLVAHASWRCVRCRRTPWHIPRVVSPLHRSPLPRSNALPLFGTAPYRAQSSCRRPGRTPRRRADSSAKPAQRRPAARRSSARRSPSAGLCPG